MKVMVTGHNGYIGTVLTPMLIKEGYDVVGLDTDLFKSCLYTGKIPDIPSITKDIRHIVESDLEGVDAIIHLAGLSNDPLGDYNPSLTEDINESASIKLAKLARQCNVSRFLFASSCSIYGASGDHFLNEESPYNPVTPYGVSKLRVEEEVRKLANEKFCPTYLRASTAYGLSPLIRFDLVLNNLIAWAYCTKDIYLKSDGTPWRPIVHVADIAHAYCAILKTAPEIVHNQAYNVGTTCENYRIREIAELVNNAIPEAKIAYAPDAGPDKRCYRVDCNKIARTIQAFKPQWTAERGIIELYQTYQKVGLFLEDFEGDKYKRIAHIKKLVMQGKLDTSFYWKN